MAVKLCLATRRIPAVPFSKVATPATPAGGDTGNLSGLFRDAESNPEQVQCAFLNIKTPFSAKYVLEQVIVDDIC